MTELLDDTTVRVATEVNLPVGRAFRLFTDEIGSWWDADKHILQAPLAEMVFEPFVGGRIIDRGIDGSECAWARVLVYEPPECVVFSWDLNIRWELETNHDLCSEIEIRFIPSDENSTRVELTHRHLDRHGPGWELMRDAVAGGWNLDGFTRVASERADRLLPHISDETMHERLGRTRFYTLQILRVTDQCIRPDVDPIIWEHGRRNMALIEAGEMSMVLPASDESDLAGIAVFPLDVEQVRAIMEDDPGVQAGIFTYELHTVRGFPGATL